MLFGQMFMDSGFPNRYEIPQFYALHVWLWKFNPSGLFKPFNPNVSCNPGPAGIGNATPRSPRRRRSPRPAREPGSSARCARPGPSRAGRPTLPSAGARRLLRPRPRYLAAPGRRPPFRQVVDPSD